MNIRRSTPPGMRVRKFHNGGKGPGHPHEELTTEVLDEILNSKVERPAYKFSEFRYTVGNHEGGINGYSAIQNESDPNKLSTGKGKYQFDAESAQTAYTRAKWIAKERGYSLPAMTEEQFKNMDQVSPELQDLLFTAHFARDENSLVSTVLTDQSQWADQWAKGHWKGNFDKDYETRVKSFKHTLDNQEGTGNPRKDVGPAFQPIFPND
tara:strand:+ start:547 stop:1173 length:627 start_codon:yes stop_codon:yes gene_type:complete